MTKKEKAGSGALLKTLKPINDVPVQNMKHGKTIQIIGLLFTLALTARTAFTEPAAESLPQAVNASAESQNEGLAESKPIRHISADLQFLYETTQNDPLKTDLVIDEQYPWIDLKREIERRRREGKTRESLQDLQRGLDEKIKQMAQVEETLSKKIKKNTQTNENFLYLVKLYESMSPEKVSELLRQMPLQVSVEILKKMNMKKSSQVLAVMEEKMAGEMSRRLMQPEAVNKN